MEENWTVPSRPPLFFRLWRPAQVRAVVALVHGLGEHCGRYGHVAAALNQAEYALLAMDLYGHGRSGGQRGHIPAYETLLDEIAMLLEEAGRRFPGRPRFLYGHSMGGNLVLNYALRRRPHLNGVIATGPALRTASPPPAWQTTLARLIERVWPAFSMPNGLPRPFLARDPAVVQAYTDDPLVHNRVSARLGLAILESGRWALEHAAEMPLPLLLMHGTADRLTDPEASRAFATRASGDCALLLWEGFYHELHNEPEKEAVFAVMLDWLERHLQPLLEETGE